MSINNNIWELAEAYVAGTLSQEEFTSIKGKLSTDAAFAAEFYESTDLIRSISGSGKQKRFRSMVQDIAAGQTKQIPLKRQFRLPAIPAIWRTAAVAAGVALLTSTITYWSITPSLKKTDTRYRTISREVGNLKKAQAIQQAQQQEQQKKLTEILKQNTKPAPPPSDVAYTGTGFALTNDGYFITANHVIHHEGTGAFDSVYIQNHEGQYFKAELVAFDAIADIALLRVEKKNFRFSKNDLPYTFVSSKSNLGARIYTLGFPTESIVYGEGYISARNGYDGNGDQYTLELPVGYGQSGSPVIDEKGNVLGILAAKGNDEISNTYAITSKSMIDFLNKNAPKQLHLPKTNKLAHLSREMQVEKMERFAFSIKVYKK